MKLDENVTRQTINTLDYYEDPENIEQVPVDILRIMYNDIKEDEWN